MKNLLAIFLMVFLFASCEGPAGPPGQDGGITEWWIKEDIKVKSSDWELVYNENKDPIYIYEYRIDDQDMSLYTDTYRKGLITTYMYLDFDDDAEAQTALPNPVHRRDAKDNSILWTETYSCDYTRDGFLIFKVTFSDFFTDQRPPETHFKAVITY